MSKQSVPNKRIPIGTVAPISKKLGAGSAPKSGTGFIAKSASVKNSFGAGGKTGNSFGSSGKTNSSFGKSSVPLSSSSKNSSPLGSSGKSPKPPVIISKSTNAFTSSPSKSYPSTSFSSPRKPSTSLGIIWIPTRRHNKKKEYVHIAHRDDGYKDRSPSMYQYEHMSGDSPSHLPFKKKDEEATLLVSERAKGPIATAASSGAVVAAIEPPQDNSEPGNPEEKQEKQEFIQYKEETKEDAGDTNFRDNDKDSFLGNDSETSKSPVSPNEKEKGDLVDSVYLRPPPPHKVRSNTSLNDDEECGIKCLYYTLQCCDCVLM